MRPQQERAYANFISTIADSKDLHLEDKLKILQYMSDEMLAIDNTLGYLECQQILKELNERR